MKIRTGDKCPCCGQPVTTKDPQRLAMLSQLATIARQHRTCGTCPVAVATAYDYLVVCPFAERRDGVGLRVREYVCTLEVVE